MEIFNGKVSFYMSTQKACKKEVFTEPIPMFYASHFADLDILVVGVVSMTDWGWKLVSSQVYC